MQTKKSHGGIFCSGNHLNRSEGNQDTHPGGGTDDIPRLLKATLGLPLQLVTGYKGTGPVRLAFNAGEVQGICNSIESFKANWRNEMDKGEIVMVVQAAIRPHPEFPNLPWAVDLAKTNDAKKLMQTLARVNGVSIRKRPPNRIKRRLRDLPLQFQRPYGRCHEHQGA